MANKKKRKKKLKYNNILIILVLISSLFLIHHILLLGPIEANIRYMIIGGILFINFIFFTIKKKKSSNLATIMMILFISINIFCSYSINKVYGLIDSINKNKITYSSSLIALKNSDINETTDINNLKIGMVDDTMSIDNYILPKEIINDKSLDKNNKIIDYSDILTMIDDLYNKKIDLMFISSNYSSMFQDTEGYEDINEKVKVILEKEKVIKKEKSTFSFLNKNKKVKPFSILLMGVDSEKDGLKKNSYANGDGLMLLTFNPDTLNITMMSIPRDSYLPIACRNNTKNKLTHAGWFGTDCMIDTIENTFDIDINYYVKVNFKGVVSLIDNLGGVTVDVPKRLCTDDSNRQGQICINGGVQTLNGEQALVLARNRYDMALGDIDRGYNQQILIKGVLNKMTEVRSVTTLLDLLETISNNLDTNLTTEEILSFYNIFKDILSSRKYQKTNDILNMIQIKVNGNSKMIYFKNLNRRLWTYQLEPESIKEATKEMKINLNINEPEMVKKIIFKP